MSKSIDLRQLLIGLCLSPSLGLCGEAAVNTDFGNLTSSKLEYRKYQSDFKLRGWQIRKNVYWGQLKVAGEHGMGIVIEKHNTAWGISTRGAGVLYRF